MPVLQETERLPITVACPDLASVVRENKLNQIPDGRIVLDDQHTWSGHHGSSSLREQPPRADPALAASPGGGFDLAATSTAQGASAPLHATQPHSDSPTLIEASFTQTSRLT